MDQNQIKTLRDTFLQDLEQEYKITQRVLSAAANGNNKEYKPDANAKTAFELAWHIASSDCWFADSIYKGTFEGSDESAAPADIKTIGDVSNWYSNSFASELEKLRSLTPDMLAKTLNFFNVVTLPAVMFMALLRNHSIHHRGQLSTYLRPMGSKVPSIYGGSYDEPINM